MRSICCSSFGAGPRLAGVASFCPMRASTETASAWAIAGSSETGTRRRRGDHLLGEFQGLCELDLGEPVGLAQLGDARTERFEELLLVLSHGKVGSAIEMWSGMHTLILTMRNAVDCTPKWRSLCAELFYPPGT
jgi:hypothetical protein